jgi:hypothetical protein
MNTPHFIGMRSDIHCDSSGGERIIGKGHVID